MSKEENDFYFINGFECDEIADEYSILKGPNNFECVLTEPEDREWFRDLNPVVAKLNELYKENDKLTTELYSKNMAIKQALALLRKWNDSLALQILEDILSSYR
jgi:hypothetical protein